VSNFPNELAYLVAKESAASRRDTARIVEMIERLAAALGMTIAIASHGDPQKIETPIAGAEAYAMEEAVGRSKLLRILGGAA
jgi:hypothetical protein